MESEKDDNQQTSNGQPINSQYSPTLSNVESEFSQPVASIQNIEQQNASPYLNEVEQLNLNDFNAEPVQETKSAAASQSKK